MENESEIIGYIKYDGERVAPGVLDAGQAGSALDGLNTLIRHFNAKQAPALRDAEYEVPVRIGDGSWLAFVPEFNQQVQRHVMRRVAAVKIAPALRSGPGSRAACAVEG